MIIAVDIRGAGEYKNFIYQTFKRITDRYPEHTFLFISDKVLHSSFIFSKNVIPEVIQHKKISLLNNYKISSLLNRYKADVLVTEQLLKAKIPQCLIAYDKPVPGNLKKAKVVVTDSQFSKKEIISKYKVDDNIIEVIYKGIDGTFIPVSFEEREKIKEQYSDGNEYFLFSGEMNLANNLLNLLKAFSSFKKMQKSNMQLLMVLEKELDKEFLEKLNSFKYKNEVKVLQDINEEELVQITAAAYAFVYPFSEDYIHSLTAMQSEVPVIVNNTGALPEVCGDAALYVCADDPKDIADKMMLVFKDENLRCKLIQKGKKQVEQYRWDKSAQQLWNSILKSTQ